MTNPTEAMREAFEKWYAKEIKSLNNPDRLRWEALKAYQAATLAADEKYRALVEEVELYRKALPAVYDTFRFIGAIFSEVTTADPQKMQKASANTVQRLKHAMEHISQVLEQVEALSRAEQPQDAVQGSHEVT